MGIKFEMEGFDNLKRNLKKKIEAAKELDGEHSIPLADLLSPEFLAACSRFQSANALIEASGFEVESPGDFAAIPDAEWDAFIAANTSYENWKDMLAAAGKAYAIKKLGF